MGRKTKTQLAAQKAVMATAEKATQTLSEKLAALLKKHMPGMLGAGKGCQFTIAGLIEEGGMASVRLTYQMNVSDGMGFPLDDGQQALPLVPASDASQPGGAA